MLFDVFFIKNLFKGNQSVAIKEKGDAGLI